MDDRYTKIDTQFDKIDSKIERIQDSVASIDKTLVRNTESLEYHIQRTNLLEKKLEPVEQHVAMVNGAFKLVGIIAIILGIAASIQKLF